jgi:hypothetical protein
VGNVLSGSTFSSGSAGINQTGTMANKGGSGTTLTPGTSAQAFPQGYYGGSTSDGKVTGDSNLAAGNIATGKSIFTVSGTYTGIGTAAAAQVETGYTASNSSTSGFSGTMSNNGAQNFSPSTSAQTVPAGYTSGGTVSAVTGTATVGQVLSGSTFSSASGISQTGTEANNGASGFTPSASSQNIPAGYYNGSGTVAAVSNLSAGNIATQQTVGGVAGSYTGIKSIQYGSISLSTSVTSNTATISSVTTANAVVIPMGFYLSIADVPWEYEYPTFTLTNSTTVTATIGAVPTATITANFMVLEFANLKSNQSGTINLNSVTSNTAAISSVTTANAMLFVRGCTEMASNTFSPEGQYMPITTLTNSTTVTATRLATALDSMTVAFTVCEHY